MSNYILDFLLLSTSSILFHDSSILLVVKVTKPDIIRIFYYPPTAISKSYHPTLQQHILILHYYFFLRAIYNSRIFGEVISCLKPSLRIREKMYILFIKLHKLTVKSILICLNHATLYNQDDQPRPELGTE